jgi:hypothetical protein
MKYTGVLSRLRNDCRRGAVVASIGGVFVIGSEVLENLVPVQDELWGIFIAILILVMLRPLYWLALHMAGEDAAEREVTSSLEKHKLDVYRAAVAGALEDGVVTEKEKCILKSLRENLQLTESEARRLESERTDRER